MPRNLGVYSNALSVPRKQDIEALRAELEILDFSGTIPTSSWTPSEGQFYYQVKIAKMTSDDVPLVYPQWTVDMNNEQQSWNRLTSIQTSQGYVRFYSSTAFTTPVNYVLLYNFRKDDLNGRN